MHGLFVVHQVDSESQVETDGGGTGEGGEHVHGLKHEAPIIPGCRPPLDMHRQSTASRSQFGQSSAQTATAQALRSKKKEYEAIAALEQSCAGLIATLEGMAADLNTTAEATIGAICPLSLGSNAAEWCLWSFGSYREGDGTLDRNVPDSQHKPCVEIKGNPPKVVR
jgi:hypothetical protein